MVTDEYTPGELRKATGETGQALFQHALAVDPGNAYPTVSDHLRQHYGDRQRPFSILKAERYALGSAIGNLIFLYVIEGDGPEARFIDYSMSDYDGVTPSADLIEDPYLRFWDNIVHSLAEAEAKLDHSEYGSVVTQLQKRYEWIMVHDSSTLDTRKPVLPRTMGSRSEGPAQAAFYVQAFGLGLAKQSELPDEATVLTPAHEAVLVPMKHASQHVLPFRGTGVFWRGQDDDGTYLKQPLEPGKNIADLGSVQLSTSHGGKSRLDLGGALQPSERWLQLHR